MPSNKHEVPLELFRDRAELGPKIARELGVPVPEGLCWRLGPETVTMLNPAELHLDVSLIGSDSDRPVFAIINEVQELERMMTISLGDYPWKSEFALQHQALGRAEGEALGLAKGEARGFAKGEAKAILDVLSARGISVDPDSRRRIRECTDLDQLTHWVKRAIEVSSAAELFDVVVSSAHELFD
ncbi:hypothetical protein [Nocardia aurantia]|uniref:Uncharacterized protein n=1 Tax=Nocardia aurantia TaxID=2585199 RepID=A0A7K0DJS0_9NOCA|nr:hypothetical protein [Nocardia aurantia]MQY25482.1 hypothetical protein [Nocardia aurantia]